VGSADEDSPMLKNKVFIADDEPYLVRALTFVLRREGYQVDWAADGRASLEKLRARKPDFALIDHRLPYRQGTEITRLIKEDPVLKDIFTILLITQEEDRTLCAASGADHILTKPFSPSKVVDFLSRVA
jgi:DNA-binding response OmpR family regulator